MTSYILRRFVNYAILTALATVFVYIAASTFFYPRRRYLGRNPPIPEDSIDSILTGYGINDKDPVLLRTWWWIERIVTNPLQDKLGHDLGNNAVISEIFSRAGVSLRLLLAGAIIAAVLGVVPACGARCASTRPRTRSSPTPRSSSSRPPPSWAAWSCRSSRRTSTTRPVTS